MINITPLNRKGLIKYLETDEYRNARFIPITRHRALSHIHNPRAEDEDILMLLAHSSSELVGYLGVLADWIYESDGTRHKCGWLSCMWVDPNFRGQGISKRLVKTALEYWSQNILVTEFTAAAKGLYDKVGAFRDLQILEGIRLYRRLDLAKILPPKRAFFAKIKGVLTYIDYASNLVLDARFLFDRPGNIKHMSYIDSLDAEVRNFIQSKSTGHLFSRQSQEIDWILQYPWIIKAPSVDDFSARYHFSSVDSDFSFSAIKLKNERGAMTGFLLFAKRGKNLKLPYCFYDAEQLPKIICIIKMHLKKWHISTFTVFHKAIVEQLAKQYTFSFYKKKIKRHFIISKKLDHFIIGNVHLIQDGDADCAFT